MSERSDEDGAQRLFEGLGEGGAKRPSDRSQEGQPGLAELLRHLGELSLRGDGTATPSAESAMGFRTLAAREAMLSDLVAGMCPPGINPQFWLQWMKGGEEPYEAPNLRRPRTSDKNIGRAVDRSNRRVDLGVERVEKARTALALAERDLEATRAFDAALVQWAVSDHLASVMAPMFAMGPAWVIMRVLSGYVGVAEMTEETALASSAKQTAEIEGRVRADRKASSRTALDVLDLWAGDVGFERDLRLAVMGVVERYEKREADAERAGRRRRSRAMMATQAHPDTTLSNEAVLDGFDPLPEL